MFVEFGWIHIYIGLAALAITLVVLWKRKKSLSYQFLFSVFWIYLMGVVSVVVFPFFIPDGPIEFSQKLINLNFNIIPFNFGSCEMIDLCIRGVYENILLTVPFGFGISFILHLKPKNIIWLALAVGFTFEITQLIIAFTFRSAFRAVDINDVILNMAGVLLGYGIFKLFALFYSYLTDRFEIQHKYIFAYIYDIVRQKQ